MNNVWLKKELSLFEDYFSDYLHNLNTEERLKSAICYSALNGGKRIRPLLTLATGNISKASPQVLYAIATAIEFVHCYSLIHDDLPAMDDDDMRRGKPSCHIAFDEATAILAGDALLTESFSILSNIDELSPEITLKLIKILAEGAGIHGMVQGQMRDLLAENRTITLHELQNIHQLKTGALIKSSILMGYYAGSSSNIQNAKEINHFANLIGLAFQIQDDVLDAVSTSDILGKTVGKDQKQAKSTYISILGLEEAKKAALELTEDALTTLQSLGSQAVPLTDLTQFVIARHY